MSILLVEDHPVTLKTTADILRLKGYKVRTAANYVEAKEALKVKCPSVLVIDLVLPCGRYGTELLDEPEIKCNWDAIRVIVTSALNPSDSQVRNLSGLPPNSDTITKPFKVKELVALIEKSIQHVGGV